MQRYSSSDTGFDPSSPAIPSRTRIHTLAPLHQPKPGLFRFLLEWFNGPVAEKISNQFSTLLLARAARGTNVEAMRAEIAIRKQVFIISLQRAFHGALPT